MTSEIAHLTQVYIKGLWNQYHIDWALNPQVNILIGINGSGKSTILTLIFESLKRVSNPDYPTELSGRCHKVEIEFSDNTAEMPAVDYIRHLENQVLSHELKSHIEESSNFPVFTNLDMKLAQAIDGFKDFRLNLEHSVQQETSNLETQIRELTQRSNLAKVELAQIGELYRQIEGIRQRIYGKRDLFIETVNRLFAETGKSVTFDKNNSLVFQQTHSGKMLTPDLLSSGEKQILVILLKVVSQNNQPYILLTDEPEISMHLSWQVDLIDTILNLNENCQIILATHSPSIIQKGWKNKVRLMKNKTDDERGILQEIEK